MDTHSEEKKHKCKYCEYKSHQACNLRTHIKKMHSDIETITEEDIKAACILSDMKKSEEVLTNFSTLTTIIDVTGDSDVTSSSINPDGHKRKSKRRYKRKSKRRYKRKSKRRSKRSSRRNRF
jgi:hypothetical protein